MGKDKFKVFEGVFDDATLNTLETLKRQRYYDKLDIPIKTGKEGDVYLALKYSENEEEESEKFAIKMFRITSANFKKISAYITRDFRFRSIKGNLRKVILMWAQKEYRNLLLCHKANMNVPFPYKQRNNVIVMEYIAGPMLKDHFLENPQEFFDCLVEQIALMRFEAKLVHADLSEFNILVRDEMPVIIDVGQSMNIKNEEDFKTYYDLYERDVRNVVNHFNKKYGLDLNLEEVLENIENYFN